MAALWSLGTWMVTGIFRASYLLVRPRRPQTSRQGRPQPPRLDATDRHLVRSHEDAERTHRSSHAGERRVPIHRPSPGRGRAGRGEPRLEVHVANLEPALGAMGLGVDATDEVAMMEDRQRVVAVHALGPGRVDLDAVIEAEQARRPVAVPEQRIARRRVPGAKRGNVR